MRFTVRSPPMVKVPAAAALTVICRHTPADLIPMLSLDARSTKDLDAFETIFFARHVLYGATLIPREPANPRRTTGIRASRAQATRAPCRSEERRVGKECRS